MNIAPRLFVVSTREREAQIIREVAERLGFHITLLQNSQELKTALLTETPHILVFEPENDSETLELAMKSMFHTIMLLMAPKSPAIPPYFQLFKEHKMACITYPFHPKEVEFFLTGLSKEYLGDANG